MRPFNGPGYRKSCRVVIGLCQSGGCKSEKQHGAEECLLEGGAKLRTPDQVAYEGRDGYEASQDDEPELLERAEFALALAYDSPDAGAEWSGD
jgi:hypothetical protein